MKYEELPGFFIGSDPRRSYEDADPGIQKELEDELAKLEPRTPTPIGNCEEFRGFVNTILLCVYEEFS